MRIVILTNEGDESPRLSDDEVRKMARVMLASQHDDRVTVVRGDEAAIIESVQIGDRYNEALPGRIVYT